MAGAPLWKLLIINCCRAMYAIASLTSEREREREKLYEFYILIEKPLSDPITHACELQYIHIYINIHSMCSNTGTI